MAFVTIFGGASPFVKEDMSQAEVFLRTKSSHESCNITAAPHTIDDTPVY